MTTAPRCPSPRTDYVPPDPGQSDAKNPEALRYWARTLEKVKQELGIAGV